MVEVLHNISYNDVLFDYEAYTWAEDEDDNYNGQIFYDDAYPIASLKTEFTNYHSIPKSSEKTILADLDRINIPDDIKIEAERIYQQLDTNTKRGKRRKKLLFYCISKAYLSLNQPKDPKYVAELVGISATQISKAHSMCSESQTNYKPPCVRLTALDFIPEYHQKVGLDKSCLSSVISLANEILNKDPELNENYPQVVAAGILLYYMTINGLTVNKKDFSKIVLRSEMTISKMYKRISLIHNS
jgi:transcription initiation factor TFIIIB Brf1 subunit/transcription initiation factor TFIIB